MTAVKIDSVYKTYKDGKMVLDNICLNIKKGSRKVLFGPSGCGKTTLLKIIAGLEAPDRGSIIINEKTVYKDGKTIIEPYNRSVSMVFQDLALWPHMNVKGNLMFGLKAHHIKSDDAEKQIKNMLRLTGLSGFEKRKVTELSGGEMQRVALARALVLNPDILLMDEPLSSLDEKMNIRIRRDIIDLQEQLNFTLIYVTHNKQEAEDIATEPFFLM